MNAESLLEHYEKIADAPDAMARLRRLILDLAVRGKLVPQYANDEPAAELLKRVAKEKARLVIEGGFNSLEPRDGASAIAEPFEVPQTWTWCLLDEIAGIARGGSPRPIKSYLTKDANGIPWIKIGDSTRGSIYIDSTEECIKPDGLSRSRYVVPGDLLLSNSMSFGFPYITNISGCIHDGWLVIRTPGNQISKLYIHRLFLSEYARQEFARAAAGAVVQNLNADKVRRLRVPLPPLAEQHRIVAKVDELMALCDQLEAARVGREATRDRLTAASLARLNTPDPETFPEDARFALDALPALTARPDQIKQLRQTILNLAVRGKLVSQDPTDEPAQALLERVSMERAERATNGDIPKPKATNRDIARLSDGLPVGWSPIALGEVCDVVTSGSRGWGEYYADSGAGFVRAQNIRFGRMRLDDLAYVQPPSNSEGSRTQVYRNDLLIVITGAGVTNPALLEEGLGEAYVSQHVGLVRPSDSSLSRWLLLCLMADAGGRGELLECAYGAGKPGLNLDNIRSLTIPLPPLAEQHRIVIKVEELTALCDQLEASLTRADETRKKLLDALLARALAPTDTEALQEAAE